MILLVETKFPASVDKKYSSTNACAGWVSAFNETASARLMLGISTLLASPRTIERSALLAAASTLSKSSEIFTSSSPCDAMRSVWLVSRFFAKIFALVTVGEFGN